jgi:hypothetical protein
MNQPKVRDMSQTGDGLTGHTSSIPKGNAPDSARFPGDCGVTEVGFNLARDPSGNDGVKSVSTATKAAVNIIQRPTVARPNDRPQQVQCPTYNPGKGPVTKGTAVYNGSGSGRFGSI